MTADANVWRPPASTAPVRATGRGAAAQVARAPEGRGQAHHNDRPAQYRRMRNGLPVKRDPGRRRLARIVRNPYVWATVALTISYFVALFVLYRDIGSRLIAEIPQVTEELYGFPTEISWEQINEAFLLTGRYALWTVLVYVVLFILIDRLRPTTWTMKWLAFGWGACAAVFLSYHVNSWAGELMRTEGPVDASQGARAAIFSAPFVEEAAKATILFALLILLRRRIVAVHQIFTLAGLSAVGFAFTENIIYYLRTYIYAVTIYGTDANAELTSIAQMRGIMLSFGHPLFTALIALGMIVALTNRSKLVRVLAPVAGFLAAAFGHMLFNGLASIMEGAAMILAIAGWVAVLAMTVFLIFRYVTQVRTIRARLTELVQMGWIAESDPHQMSRIFGRWRMAATALLRGPRVFGATLRLQRNLTELAYLREAELRGTVDAMAIERARDLVVDTAQARVWAIDHTAGVPFIPPEWGQNLRAWRQRLRDRRAAKRAARPVWAPPTGAPVGAGAGSWPPPGR
ncbi:MAG: PrsW family intramembrane metalloprotease [Brooklawnia sp.]|jgi:RsiW-degrading membrane proteinase PrsW (M82 family)